MNFKKTAAVLFLVVHAHLVADNAHEIVRLRGALAAGQSCVVVTDFHDVLFKRLPRASDPSRAAGLGARFWPFLWQVSRFGVAYAGYAFGKNKKPRIEEYALSGARTPQEREALLRVISPFCLDENMAAFFSTLVHPFTHTNVPVYGCSNVGPISYQFLRDQAVHADPADQTRVIDPLVFLIDVCIADARNEYRQKDDLETFKHLFDVINDHEGDLPACILFIDDNAGNIERARTALADYRHSQPCDIIGYVFKNATTFVQDMASCFTIDR